MINFALTAVLLLLLKLLLISQGISFNIFQTLVS